MAMTERAPRDVIEILKERLGVRYRSDIDSGRNEMMRVVREALNVSSEESERIIRQLIDNGQIRYVTGDERDVEHDVEAQHDEHSDRQRRGEAEGFSDRSDNLRVNAIPGAGGPQEAASGITGPATAPVVAGGSTTPAIIPAVVDPGLTETAGTRQGGGYWDFGSETVGVVPSDSRKGQVEPREM